MAFNFDPVTNRVAWTHPVLTYPDSKQPAVSLPLDKVYRLAQDMGGLIAAYQAKLPAQRRLNHEDIKSDFLEINEVGWSLYQKLEEHSVPRNMLIEVALDLAVGYGISYGLDSNVVAGVLLSVRTYHQKSGLFPFPLTNALIDWDKLSESVREPRHFIQNEPERFSPKIIPFLRKPDDQIINSLHVFKNNPESSNLIESLRQLLTDPNNVNLLPSTRPPKKSG